jgi:hypothetical protein
MAARVVTSVLRTADRVRNTERRFGSAPEYLQCAIEQHGQPPVPVLLTVDECRNGVERAKANPEDCLPFESEQVRFDRALAAALQLKQEQWVSDACRARKEGWHLGVESAQAVHVPALRRARHAWFAVGVAASTAAQLIGLYLAGRL